MPCWCQGSGENGQAAWNQQKENNNSNRHWIELLDVEDRFWEHSTWNFEVDDTAAEDHTC